MVGSRLQMIFTTDEYGRLTVDESQNKISIIADVHGMKCWQARRFLNNIINVVGQPFQLEVIHGYVHGTAIKEMLDRSFNNVHIIERHSDPCNYGVTYMSLAA